MKRRFVLGGCAALTGLGLSTWRLRIKEPVVPAVPPPMSRAAWLAGLPPLSPPSGPMQVYHLGHSLVGRDMPALLAQMAGHIYHSQLGWGTPLRAHWEDRIEINGFDVENAHPAFRSAKEALSSGSYDAVVLTEMVELRDAVAYHGSAHYLAEWARLARAANPLSRLYFYETWHRLDDPLGWLERLDSDLELLWEREVLQAAAAAGSGPVYLIPAGQVLGAAARAAEAGQLHGIARRQDFFATADGGTDPIHLSDLGALIVAMTHHEVLYHHSPALPVDGFSSSRGVKLQIHPDAYASLQQVCHEAVRKLPQTGVAS